LAFQGKVNSKMANSDLHSGASARLARVGTIAATLMLGITISLAVASAQATKKPPEKAPPTSDTQSAWVKLCDKGELKGKDKDGKDLKKDVEMCVTLHEQIDANSGMVLVSAGLQQIKVDGKEKQHLSVTVPLGVALPVGLAITVFPKDLWEKVQKKEKLDKKEEDKLKSAKLTYSYCIQVGCSAEAEVNAELVDLLKGGSGFIVQSVRMPGTPIGQLVSLAGFKQALADPPTDTKKFKEAREGLMKQILERQKLMLQELKKQQEDLGKMQPTIEKAKEPAVDPKKKK